MFSGRRGSEAIGQLFAAFALVALALMAWRWAGREGTCRFSLRHLSGALVGLAAFALAVITLVVLGDFARQEVQAAPRGLAFLAPVQQSGSALTVEVGNIADRWTMASVIGRGWPGLLALSVWLFAPHSNALLIVVFTLIGFGTVAYLPSFWALPSSFLAASAAAAAVGFINCTASIGGFFGPKIIGDLSQRTGSFRAGFVFMVVCWIIASLLVLLCRPQRVLTRQD